MLFIKVGIGESCWFCLTLRKVIQKKHEGVQPPFGPARVKSGDGEDKQIRNLVNFDPGSFKVSNIYQGHFQSLYCPAQLFIDNLAIILQEKIQDKFLTGTENMTHGY